MPDFVDIPINATAEELEAVARMGTAPEDGKAYGRKNGEWVEVINTVEQDYNPDSANAQSGKAVAEGIGRPILLWKFDAYSQNDHKFASEYTLVSSYDTTWSSHFYNYNASNPPILNDYAISQDGGLYQITYLSTRKITYTFQKSLTAADQTYSSTSPNAQSGAAVAEATSNFITNTVNNLTNYYLKSETYTKAEVQNLISAIQTAHFEVVQTLPQTGETNVIYLVPRTDSETGNVYDEYIYVSNAWEKIGSTDVDLTGYATEYWVNQQIANFLTQSQIQSLINTALTNYYTKTEADTLLEDKADVNGIYNKMVVGNAQNLVSTKKINDNTPYNFRTSGGSLDIKSGVGNLEEDALVGGTVAWNQLVDTESTDVTVPNEHIFLSKIDNVYTISISDGTPISIVTQTDNIFDLSQMFGITIANYIYSLENANAGDGVAWFRSYFSKDYYEYNAGELISVKTSAHKMIGFNAYNPQTGTAKLVGGKKYQVDGTYSDLSFEGTTVTLDSNNYFTPNLTGVLTVTGGNSTDTCVHLVWDGERDGEYEPYIEYNYPLDNNLTLFGLYQLDANNNLYCNGDIYQSDGTVTRQLRIVDLGSLNWTSDSRRPNVRYVGVSGKFTDSKGLCSSVYTVYTGTGPDLLPNKALGTDNSYGATIIFIKDDDTVGKTREEVQQMLTGVKFMYEVSFPLVEQAAPFADSQYVDDWGTEEYIDNRAVAIPVGHNTKYTVNLKAKLEMAPNSPSQGDGDYIVRQTNGINEYTKVILPTKTSDLVNDSGFLTLSTLPIYNGGVE